MRRQTRYEPDGKIKGFSPITHAMIGDGCRLADGTAFKLLMICLDKSLGRSLKKDGTYEEATEELTTARLAEMARCDQRSVVRELGDLMHRGVIAWDQPKKGVNVVTCLFRTWASLPDYRPGPVAEPELEQATEESEGEIKAKDPTVTPVTTKPVFTGARKSSRPVKVNAGVESVQIKAGDIDAKWSAVVHSGVLIVSLEQKWEVENGVKGLLNPKGISEKPRQICRDSVPNQAEPHRRSKGEDLNGVQSTPKGRGVQSGPGSVNHPRAKELCSLFDDLLMHSCRKTLSGDPVALLACCEAVGTVPHDELVHAVMVRSRRKISTPLSCAAILREIRHNWGAQTKHRDKVSESVRRCAACKTETAAIDGLCYGCAEKALSA